MRTSPRALLLAGVVLTFVLSLLILPWGAQAAGSLAVSTPAPREDRVVLPSPTDPQAQRLLELANRARWENGQIPPLKWNDALGHSALSHSQSMAQNDFFSHEGADLSSPWDRIDAAGYGNWYVLGENIAAGYENSEDVVNAWLVSPQHRENLLNPELHEAGVGHVFQAGDTYPGTTWGYEHYWTLDMGSRWDAYPLIIAGEAYSTTSRTVQLYCYGAEGTAEMRLSTDGVNWSEWRPYRPALSWDLPPGNGPKTVYSQTRDGQGNVQQSQDEIVLAESQAPVVQPAQALFILLQGASTGQPQRYRVQITDPTGMIHNWRATWDQNWLRLSTPGGVFPSGVFLVLTDQARTLPTGLYTATLSCWGGDLQVQVPVRLFVFPRVYSAWLPIVLKDQ
jgi:uncharacterized protein YkwD